LKHPVASGGIIGAVIDGGGSGGLQNPSLFGAVPGWQHVNVLPVPHDEAVVTQ